MKKTLTKSSEQTKKLSANFAKKLQNGTVVCLRGDLGSGKTTFAQGILGALGAEKPFTSPTFTLVRTYELPKKTQGMKRVYHVDAYRIEKEDAESVGWSDMLSDKEALVLVEWPERLGKLVPQSAQRISFETIGEKTRTITFHD